MNKKALIIVGVLLLLLLGGWYALSKNSPEGGSTTSTNGKQETSGASSLKDLITKGVAQSCTFNSQGSTGTTYVNGGKVRTDFEVTVGGTTQKTHIIMMDSTSYMWIDGQTTGYKMSFDPNATPAATSGTSTAPKGNFDAAANMDYKCSTWIVDGSKFDLPKGVTFAEFAVPTMPKQGDTSSQCSYCDSLTGDSKTQCKSALNCK